MNRISVVPERGTPTMKIGLLSHDGKAAPRFALAARIERSIH
jgi:hypothetical protein